MPNTYPLKLNVDPVPAGHTTMARSGTRELLSSSLPQARTLIAAPEWADPMIAVSCPPPMIAGAAYGRY